MKLIDLIIDILEESPIPLKQGEILELAEKHPAFSSCAELQRVAVPLSTVARCLTDYSSGTKPVFAVADEGAAKRSQKRFFLKTKDIPEVKNTPELRLKLSKTKKSTRTNLIRFLERVMKFMKDNFMADDYSVK